MPTSVAWVFSLSLTHFSKAPCRVRSAGGFCYSKTFLEMHVRFRLLSHLAKNFDCSSGLSSATVILSSHIGRGSQGPDSSSVIVLFPGHAGCRNLTRDEDVSPALIQGETGLLRSNKRIAQLDGSSLGRKKVERRLFFYFRKGSFQERHLLTGGAMPKFRCFAPCARRWGHFFVSVLRPQQRHVAKRNWEKHLPAREPRFRQWTSGLLSCLPAKERRCVRFGLTAAAKKKKFQPEVVFYFFPD